MIYLLPLSVCLGVLLVLGLVERVSRDRARAAVPIRVHVNGTRGKSSVTRLIWAALREAGVPAVAKTTGTRPRVLMPDGTERPVRRRAPSNIREQLWLLRVARRAGARAVVAECMAVRPDLQWVAEHDMIGATVGVITNVRTDHTEVMGDALPEVAASMANTIPRNGVLITAEERFVPLFQRRAERCGARVVLAPVSHADRRRETGQPARQTENRAIALAVTRELGIADQVALAGMASAPPDPGDAQSGLVRAGSRNVLWYDAASANDPESLALLLEEWGLAAEVAGPTASDDRPRLDRALVVYNHRADRPGRLASFAVQSEAFSRSASVVVTGDRPSLTLWRAARRSRGGRPLGFASRRRLGSAVKDALEAHRPDTLGAVLFCGNTRGLNVERLLSEVGSGQWAVGSGEAQGSSEGTRG
jgi:poly-gamma-glutamate synthase PgsB/CapB